MVHFNINYSHLFLGIFVKSEILIWKGRQDNNVKIIGAFIFPKQLCARVAFSVY